MLLHCALLAASVVAAEPWPSVDQLPVVEGLPDPFLMRDGSRVATLDDWRNRRDEIIDTLLHYEYGHVPPAPDNLRVNQESVEAALDGAAVLKRVTLFFGPGDGLRMRAGMYAPAAGDGPFPVILAIEPVWDAAFLPLARKMVERGYILAGYECFDLDQDNADRSDGVHPLYPDYDWATIAAWAWGASRMVDYLRTQDAVHSERIALTGHSRRGKTALLAGALDERIALVAPHASGAGGAGSYRIQPAKSETLDDITSPERFHYWFSPRLREFAGKEDRLPFDQHFLKALVAPRALISLEARDDLWANPLGTQQTHLAAQPVFDWLGAPDHNAFFIRPGGHDTTMDDWEALLDYADYVFFGRPTTKDFKMRPFPDAPKPFSWHAP